MPDEILVEVAYALPEEQIIISIKVPTKFNVKQAIEKSGIQKKFPCIDLSKNKVGIFGKKTTLDHLLKDRDRIEIYRPLILDPKEMRRKRAAKKRVLLPDPKFNDQLVTRFVNNLMWAGKKSVAFKVFYDAIAIVDERKEDEEKSALEIWKEALSNVMPQVEVRSRRVGGATFQIPMQIRPDRKVSMAIKWMILYTRKRNEKTMAQRLAAEILAAAKEEGAAVKKRTDTHKMAEANKAFSHFRF